MLPRSLLWMTLPCLFLATLGCQKKERAQTGTASSPAKSGAPQSPPMPAPLASERVEIPGGSLVAGSTPGEAGRDPELEPRRVSIEMGPYQIDRLPYPNDPTKPALTNVPREEARRLCAERSARLCTELEWERACKGPRNLRFATGDEWEARCSEKPNECASGFDVLGMGALEEWVSSDVRGDDEDATKAVVRGAAPSAPAEQHRCARRQAAPGATTKAELGFRCCKGAPNAAVVPEPKLGAVFKKDRLTAEQLAKLLASDPRTAALTKDLKFFREPDAANTVVERGPGDRKGFLFTVAPLLWNPAPGAEFLIVSARSGENTSFVVAFYVLGEDEFKLAASFVMKGEAGPIALAYHDSIRPRLHFSSCWGCPGETGKILFRPPEMVVILQP